ncbi:aminotriazole resistance protein [Ophiocordyceps camponoti-floridani]|uniref:Aminotriazole resistance protein n=1 Tax=Ophiocordyceps camponoti-floridani TaxID=2030778 RepID=A0A8H4QCY0_9HYPO|nr:aminotriazole resistance protein [Ophiocordyceps camponoti-floridani]
MSKTSFDGPSQHDVSKHPPPSSSHGPKTESASPARPVSIESRGSGSRASGSREYVKPVKAYIIIVYLTLVTFMTSVSTGLITTGIPTMAVELGIPPQTLYWPLSVYSLTTGTCLIVAGTVADVVGSRRVFLAGTLLLAGFTLGCGLSVTGLQLTMFRAMQGIAVAMCLPTSVGILCNAIAPGRIRNVAFACTGLGQPLGFSTGLVLSGVFIKTVGWRPGWYIAAGTLVVCVPVGLYLLPVDRLAQPPSLQRLRRRVDWPGAIIESSCFAMLAFVLVQISEDRKLIHDKTVIVLLVLSLVLMPVFVWWMGFASKHGLPVLIPNELWARLTFSSVCIMVLMSYAVMQVLELYATLFFQKVQGLDPLQSSIRLLPSMLVGAALNLAIGLFIHRVSAMWLVFSTSLACAGSPLIMALIRPEWPYWYAAFPAQLLHPLSADVLFCVGLIVISQVFPEDTKSLAGAVFNTVAQFGTSLGLAVIGIIASSVTEASGYQDKASPAALFQGYKAAFWATFGLTLAIAVVSIIGLRRTGSANDVQEQGGEPSSQ